MQGAAFATAENSVFPDGKHYVTIFVQATAPEVRGGCLPHTAQSAWLQHSHAQGSLQANELVC